MGYAVLKNIQNSYLFKQDLDGVCKIVGPSCGASDAKISHDSTDAESYKQLHILVFMSQQFHKH